MKTNLLRTAVLFLVFSFSVFVGKAQWVSIPDTNFGTWLDTGGYAACLQGNNQIGWQMDTTCTAVVSVNSVSFYSTAISNLSGIEYFDNLDSLDVQYNTISLIPAVPKGLRYFNCSYNDLASLPALP